MYSRINFKKDTLLKAADLNHMEDGIASNSSIYQNLVDNSTITLENNVEYISTTNITNLTITLPETIDLNFRCCLDFGCGETAPILTYPESILWTGCSLDLNGLFYPYTNYRYHLDIWFDGVYVRANVSGVYVECEE